MNRICYVLGWSVCVVAFCQAAQPTLLVPSVTFEQTRFLVEEDEIKVVEKLISVTQDQLTKQQQLKELMVQFQKDREAFVQGRQTRSHTGQLVRLARQIYERILAEHFEHLFSKEYLDELQFFSSIAGKQAMSRP